MRLLKAEDLLAQRENVRTVRVEWSSGEIPTVIDGVNRGERILRGEDMVKTESAKILTNRLQWAAEDFGDAIEVSSAREARGESDPVMTAIEGQLRTMLGIPAEAATS